MTKINDIEIDASTYEMVSRFKIVEHILEEDAEVKPHLFFQAVKNFLFSISSKDPTPFHFDIARKTLSKIDEEALQDDENVYHLAKELLETLNELNRKIRLPITIEKTIKQCREQDKQERPSFYIDFIDFPEADPKFEKQFFENGLAKWDLAYLKLLKSIGQKGQEQSKKLTDQFKQNDNRWDRFFWFRKKESDDQLHFFNSPAFTILAGVLWEDKIKKRIKISKKNVPALPQAVLVKTIKPPLSPGTKIEITDDSKITCYSSDGRVISTVPCVDPRLVNLICKGMQCLSSLNGHKLIRWQVKTGFYNWVNEVEDIRLIRTSGGYEGIANLIGSGNSNKSITEVKAMLHAQAYGQFEFPIGGAGNMIILREIERHRNGEPSKINLILGEFLLPNYNHALPQGEKKRLVPITDLPPLIGSKNTHAAQATFQLLILEEFTKHSDRLAANGSILLPEEKLEELAYQAKLPKSSLNKVIVGWTEDDLFSKAFLQKYGDEYTLGKEYSKVQDFLEYQGKQRNDGAKGGERSTSSKKRLAKRKYLKEQGDKT